MGSDSVIIGGLPESLDRRRAADLAHRHLAEREHEGALPLGRQRLPNWMGQPIAHRGIQASAPRHTTPGDQISATRRVVSNYQRCLVWDIERAFSHLKDWRRVATRYDKLVRNFRSTVLLAAMLIWWT
jgi:transposase